MKLGTVCGTMALRKQVDMLDGARILAVEMEGISIAALDRTGARPGDRVLVVMGQAAGRYAMETPSDAVVVAVVEN